MEVEARPIGGLVIGSALVASWALIFEAHDRPLVTSIAFSLLAFTMSTVLIGALGPVFMKAGFRGRDLNKVGQPYM